MLKVKYLILGAGAAGLSLAASLLEKKETSFLVLEKEQLAGGLCRSLDVDGSPLDIGGGHFLDVRRKEVLDFVFRFMPDYEWNIFERISKIRTKSAEIDYPYEASIWQLPVEEQVDHLLSISQAGCNTGKPMPEGFREWIIWKLGDMVANQYMLPYNRKIFSIDLDRLGTYWLYKLPDVSFEETLRSCLYRKPYGKLPAHAQFYYPKKYGYGEVFQRIADSLGDKLLLGFAVKTIDFDSLLVNNGFQADVIVNTIPWAELKHGTGIPDLIQQEIDQLEYSSLDVTYHSAKQETDSLWTYFPDEHLSYHRILYRQNFLPGAKGYWTETNTKRLQEVKSFNFHNQYAYPLNTLEKPASIRCVLDWAASRSVIGLGRWGEWEHMNSDVAISKALILADQLTK